MENLLQNPYQGVYNKWCKNPDCNAMHLVWHREFINASNGYYVYRMECPCCGTTTSRTVDAMFARAKFDIIDDQDNESAILEQLYGYMYNHIKPRSKKPIPDTYGGW